MTDLIQYDLPMLNSFGAIARLGFDSLKTHQKDVKILLISIIS